MDEKIVLIAAFGSIGNEVEVFRQTLEAFGYLVIVKYIGRPNDFITILEDCFPVKYQYLVLSCHGDDGQFIMPVLGDGIYTPDEPRGNFSDIEIERYLKLKEKIIISSGCTTGMPDISRVFGRENCYIAPKDYIEGNAAILFVIRLFYELIKGELLEVAFKIAKCMDEETELFVLKEKVE